jgi:hypothetical protein
MLVADSLSFLGGFRGTHFSAIFHTFLLRHKLIAIDLLLLLCLNLCLPLGWFRISRQSEPGRQRKGTSKSSHY